MNLKEVIKISFTFFVRSKKKIGYSIILFVCTLTLLITLIATSTLENVFKVGEISIRSRSFQVFDSERNEFQSSELAAELKEMEHISDAYPFAYENSGLGFEFNVEGKNWFIEAERRTSDNLPKIKKGRKYNDDETNVMVCSEKFIDNSGSLEVLDTKQFLDKGIEVEYYDYIFDSSASGYSTDNEKHIEKFKVVGIVENRLSYPSYFSCFLPPKEIDRLYDIQSGQFDIEYQKYRKERNFFDNSSNVIIAIDKKSNVSEVIQKIEKLGYNTEPRILLDRNLFKTFYIVAGIIIFTSIFTITIITLSYAKKKLLSEEQNIKVMQTEGLTKKDIGLIYAGETFINNSIVFIITSIIALVSTLFVVNNLYIAFIEFNLFTGVHLGLFNYFITFILIVIIPSITVCLKTTKLKKKKK